MPCHACGGPLATDIPDDYELAARRAERERRARGSKGVGPDA